MKKLILLAALIVMAGCANPKQVMVQPNTWQQVNCSSHGWGWLGAAQAYSMTDKCISSNRTLGYIPIEEAEATDGPKFIGPAIEKSKGSDKPLWSVKDTWEYSVNGNPAKIFVEKVDAGTYQINTGAAVNILDGSLGYQSVVKNNIIDTIYDPALHPFDWPLFVGKKWDSSGEMKRNGGALALSTHHEVKGFGKVKVPAGEFDVYYILSKSDYGARVSELWYSPDVKYYVKGITYTNAGKLSEELISYQVK